MNQHQIDLLPADILARSRAGTRASRVVALSVLAGVLLMGASTQARIALGDVRNQLFTTQSSANQVLELERQDSLLRRERRKLQQTVERYYSVAPNLDLSRVIAAIANAMPDSMTLESLDFRAGAQRQNIGPRRRAPVNPDQTPRRVLTGEITGFALRDEDIAALVDSLMHTPPLERVTLDYSRTHLVRGRSAREFRLSFSIDLEVVYQFIDESSGGEGRDVE